MDTNRIVIRRREGGWDVEADDKLADRLCWGEMIEQVIHLTHAEIKTQRYRSLTVYEHEMEEARRNAPRPSMADPKQCPIDPECAQGRDHPGECDPIPF